MTEFIPTVSMESQHFVDGLTSREFSSIYTVRQLLPDEVRSRLDGKWVFGKKDPSWKDFENFVAKGFMRTRKHVLRANFVQIWPTRSR